MAAVPRLEGFGWPELIRTIWQKAADDNIENRAAELAFWFLLSFFPMLLCVTSMVSMLGLAPDSQRTLMKYVGEVIPYAASSLIRQVLAQTTGGGKVWLTLFFALWSSSSATAALSDTLDPIYNLKESRPWWKSRAISFALALAMGVLMTAALIIVMYGSAVLHHTSHRSAVSFVLKIAQWPTAASLLIFTLVGVYRFAPNLPKQKWQRLLPGSIVADSRCAASACLHEPISGRR